MATTPEVIEIGNVGGPVGPKGDKGDTGATGPAGPPSSAAAISNVPAGTISGITVQAAIDELATEKVAKAGDTMTGDLTISKTNGALIVQNASASDGVGVRYNDSGGFQRWRLQRNGVTQGFELLRYDAAGANLGSVMTVDSAGAVTFVVGGNTGVSVPTPTATAHATTKAYVDSIGSVGKMSAAISTDGAVSWDSFNRTAGASLIGTSDSGHAWTPLLGGWGITANQAYKSNTLADAICTIPGVGDGLVACDVWDVSSRLAFRVVDANNFLFVRITAAGLVELFKREAGVNTAIAAAQGALVHSLYNRLEVSFTGSDITVMVSGTLVLQYKLTAAELLTYPITATACGISSGTTLTTARWDNFYTSKVPKHVVDNTRANELKMNAFDSADSLVTWDSFNRPNSVLGSWVSDSGHVWTVVSGTWNISGNKVTKTSTSPSPLVTIPGVGNGSIECNVYTQNAQVAFRVIDFQNLLYAQVSSTGNISIVKRVGDVLTVLADGPPVPLVTSTIGYRLEIAFFDDTITASIQGSYGVTYKLSAAEYTMFPNTLTTCGLTSNTAITPTWDNFCIYSLVKYAGNLTRSGDTMTGVLNVDIPSGIDVASFSGNSTVSKGTGIILKNTAVTDVDQQRIKLIVKSDGDFQISRMGNNGAVGNTYFRASSAGAIAFPEATSVTVPTPTAATHAATKAYVDAQDVSTTSGLSNKVASAISLDAAVSWDSFNRSSGAIGVSDSGHTWTSLGGTWVVAANQVNKTGAVDAVVTVPGVAEGTIACDLGDQNSYLAFRVIDLNNYLFVRILNAGYVELFKKEASVNTVLVQTPLSAYLIHSLKDRVEVSIVGSNITVLVNGEAALRHTLSTADGTLFNNTITTCGLGAPTSVTGRWDNFYTTTLANHTFESLPITGGALTGNLSMDAPTGSTTLSMKKTGNESFRIEALGDGRAYIYATGTGGAGTIAAHIAFNTLGQTVLSQPTQLAGNIVSDIVVSKANPAIYLRPTTSSIPGVWLADETGTSRWRIYRGNTNGAFAISRYDAAGALTGTPFSIDMVDGSINMAVAASVSVPTPTLTTSATTKAYVDAIGVAGRSTSEASLDQAVSWDTFNRANSGSSLGVSDSGHTWTPVVGTWGITANQAYKVSTTAESLATISGVGDGTVACDILDTTTRLCFRVIDANNYLFVSITNPIVYLYKKEAGVNAILMSLNVPPMTAGGMQRVEVSLNGNEILVYLGGEQILQYTLPASLGLLFPNTLTTCGIASGSTVSGRWDNFYTTKLTKSLPGRIAISSYVPTMILDESDQAVDARKWKLYSAAGIYTLVTTSDDEVVQMTPLTINRSTGVIGLNGTGVTAVHSGPATGQATFGPELITNGNFTGNADGWTLGGGAVYGTDNITLVAGSTVSQIITVSVSTYIISWTDTVPAGTTITVTLGTTSSGPILGSYPSNVVLIPANGAQTLTLTFSGAGTLDDVSVKLINPSTASSISNVTVRSNNPSSVGIGPSAQASLTTGTSNTGIGGNTQQSLTTGIENTAIGSYAQRRLSTGNYNTAIGRIAQTALTTGNYNTATGHSSQNDMTTGAYNDAHGYQAQQSLLSGQMNVAIGYKAQYTVQGDSNIGIGSNAQGTQTTGTQNTAIGGGTLNSPLNLVANATTTASRQTAVGYQTGLGSTSQDDDITTIGWRAIGTGIGATSLGSGARALFANSVALGFNTLSTAIDQLKTGARHIELTETTEPVAPGVDNLRLYAKDDAGVTKLAFRTSTGLTKVITGVVEGVGSPEGVITAGVGTRYIDTAATYGAIEWMKFSGTGNTGWKVSVGDTGPRAIVGSLENGWSVIGGSPVVLQRVGQMVSFYIAGLVGTNATLSTLYTLPPGFLPYRHLTSSGVDTVAKSHFEWTINYLTGTISITTGFGGIPHTSIGGGSLDATWPASTGVPWLTSAPPS